MREEGCPWEVESGVQMGGEALGGWKGWECSQVLLFALKRCLEPRSSTLNP